MSNEGEKSLEQIALEWDELMAYLRVKWHVKATVPNNKGLCAFRNLTEAKCNAIKSTPSTDTCRHCRFFRPYGYEPVLMEGDADNGY